MRQLGIYMSNLSWDHPRFDRPPVIETSFSIDFAKIERWQIPYFGLYWSTIRDRYPKLNVQSAIPSQIEDFDNYLSPSTPFTVDLDEHAPVRCWFYNENETQLVQIQRDRFIFNWKRGLSNEVYPHYENMRPTVRSEWQGLREFVLQHQLGTLQARQCEVNYINHIEKGVGWDDYSQIDQVFPGWFTHTKSSTDFFPEVIDISLRYVVPHIKARLYVRAQSAIRNVDHKEVIQLSLTMRGKPESPDTDVIFNWFDDAQEYVAQTFLKLTSESVHALWGKRENK